MDNNSFLERYSVVISSETSDFVNGARRGILTQTASEFSAVDSAVNHKRDF